MTLPKAEQAILNGIYAAVAWLLLDLGLLFQQHEAQTLSVLISQPAMLAGAVIVVACIVGLLYKSRVAALVLFLLFVVPLVLQMIKGVFPSTMMMLFFLVLLYFFLTAVLGAVSYHQLMESNQGGSDPDQPD